MNSFQRLISLLSIFIFSLTLITCIHTETTKLSTTKEKPTSQSQRHLANEKVLSGYAINSELCGRGSLKFPRVKIGTKPGTCVGLVASKEDGLRRVRNIVQYPKENFFIVVDQHPAGGKVYRLDPTKPQGSRLTLLLDHLDSPMGLAIGPNDGLVYVGLTQEIIRFDPNASNPTRTIETVARGFPARQLEFPNTKKIEISNHAQKQIVFDPEGNLFVNVGAPTDNCDIGIATTECYQSSGTKEIPPMAAIWKFAVKKGDSLPALKENETNVYVGSDKFEVYATGLRNSMAMAIHPQFSAGGAFIQFENARDLPGTDRPNEEMNVIERGKNYGWPYCYDLNKTNPEYESFVQNGSWWHFCENPSRYQAPRALLPPHVAPLGATYYFGDLLPNLKNSLLVTWHGYAATGSRVVYYKVNEFGLPEVQPKAIEYHKNCEPSTKYYIQSDGEKILSGAPYEELISDWYQVTGVRPQGAPVGITMARDGSIWLVEDKNATVLRLDIDPKNQPQELLSCDGRSENDIKILYDLIQSNVTNKERLRFVRKTFGEKYCAQCHSGFNLKSEMTDEKRDEVYAHYLLSQNDWIYPNDPEASKIHHRIRKIGLGETNPMPPNWNEVSKNSDFQNAIDKLDQLILTLVPGKSYYISPPRAPVAIVRDAKKNVCGEIPTGRVVVVEDENPKSFPDKVRIFKPESKFLRSPCLGGYYIYKSTISNKRPPQ